MEAPLLWVLELYKWACPDEELLSRTQDWLLDENSALELDPSCIPHDSQSSGLFSQMKLALQETKCRLIAPLEKIVASTSELTAEYAGISEQKTSLKKASQTETKQSLPLLDETSIERCLWRERCYLRAFALNRSERKEEAQTWFRSASEELSQVASQKASQDACQVACQVATDHILEKRHLRSLQERAKLEFLVNALNSDEDPFVLSETKSLFTSNSLDTISLIRTLAIRGLAAGEMGDFEEQETALNLEKKILFRMPLNSLYQTWKRRRAHAYLRQDRFALAELMIEEGLKDTAEFPSVHALFLSLSVELALVKDDWPEASSRLENLEKLIAQGAIPRESTQADQFRLEIALRSHSIHEDFIAKIIPSIPFFAEVVATQGDFSGDSVSWERLEPQKSLKGAAHMRSALVFGRVLILQKKAPAAQRWISAAISSAKEGGYLPILLEALFHSAGLHFALRNSVEMKRALEQARDLSRSLGLQVQQACFQYIVSFLRQGGKTERQLKPLLELLANNSSDKLETEIVYLLNHYGFLEMQQRNLLLGNGQSCSVPEAEFWGKWLSQPILMWSKEEGLLFYRTEAGRVALKELHLSRGLAQVVDHFLAQDMAVSLEEVHRLFSTAPYHPHRHEAQARSMVTRLRKEFEALGVEVSRNETTGKYQALEREGLMKILVKISDRPASE